MAKRFTDTQIWEKEWFMKLSPKLKCLWRYITERCDQSGVWEPNWHLASIYIGETVEQRDLLLLGNHVETLKNGKIFIPDFIDFQYGRLSEKSPAHNPVFRAIEKNNLSNRVFSRVSNTPMDMEEEKEKEKEKEVEIKRSTSFDENFKTAFDEITCERYAMTFKGLDLGRELQEFRTKCDNDPSTYHSRDPATLRTNFQYQLKNSKAFKTNGKRTSTIDPNELNALIEARHGGKGTTN